MSYIYEAGAIDVSWAPSGVSVDLTSGWAEDTFLTITPNSARVEHTAGAGGQYTFSKLADKGCTITMTFQDVAPVNKQLAKVSAAQDAFGGSIPMAPFIVVDNTGDSAHFVTFNAVLTEVPEIGFQKASGERTWTWVCESYIMTDDPTTVKAAKDSYVKAATTV